MKRILCPTDFSETAHNAIVYAAKLAQQINAELTLLNVQSMFDLTPADVVRGKEQAIAATQQQLEAQSREVTQAFRISCYAEVEPTARKLSAVIHDKAKRYDLIVMGSNGPDDLYQLLSGSNTYNAIIKNEVPLLIVPENYTYANIKTMVLAFDYLKERTLPFTHLVPVLKALKCELTILQVMEEAYSKDAEDDLKELQLILQDLYGDDIRFYYDTIRSSAVAQSINSYILRSQPDALALCSKHRNVFEKIFHRSVIKNISAVCSYPVLVFHA